MQPILGVFSQNAPPLFDAPPGSQTISGTNFLIAYAAQYCRVDESATGCSIQIAVSGIWSAPDIGIEVSDSRLRIRRDLFGRLPMYWMELAGALWFSSHLKPLMDLLPVRKISTEAFYSYSSFSFIPSPLSPVENINSIPAGHTLERCSERWDGRLLACSSSNWNVPAATLSDENTAVEQLRCELTAEVDRQTQDLRNERVAVFLSGGLDSAITAAALVRAGADVTAYSLDFGPHGITELPFAGEVAKSLGIPLKPVRALPRDIRRSLIPTVSSVDTVFGDGVTVPLWLLNKAAAADGHTVAFNGEGGDQLFGGWTNKPLIASSVYGQLGSDEDLLYEVYMRTFHRLHGHESLVFSRTIRDAVSAIDLRKYLAAALEEMPEVGLIHRLRRANLMLKGAQNIQPRASNIAISHGLNLRSLFCSKPLADWTFTVQPELMLRGSCEKYILKRAVEDWLPSSIIYREKRGMGVPLSDWCTNSLWGHLGKYLNSRRLQKTGYWQPDIAHALAVGEVSAHLTGRRIGETLWLMLMWESWLACNSDSINAHTRYNSFCPPVPLLRLWRRETTGVT